MNEVNTIDQIKRTKKIVGTKSLSRNMKNLQTILTMEKNIHDYEFKYVGKGWIINRKMAPIDEIGHIASVKGDSEVFTNFGPGRVVLKDHK